MIIIQTGPEYTKNSKLFTIQIVGGKWIHPLLLLVMILQILLCLVFFHCHNSSVSKNCIPSSSLHFSLLTIYWKEFMFLLFEIGMNDYFKIILR